MAGPPVPFSSLPLRHTSPPTKLNAWGAYGPADELGTLNRLSPSIVLAAASEIRTGIRVSLNAAMDCFGAAPLFGRQQFKQDIYLKSPRCVHDDTWTFNTQSSTQWDGLRHFGYQAARRFYNDTTAEDIARDKVLGIEKVARQGIVGRGVLVDFARWRERGEKQADDDLKAWRSFETSEIKLSWILECLAWQGTEVKFGDVLFIRSGFWTAYHALSSDELAKIQTMTPPCLGGVEQTDEMLQWIWDNLSAVAADHPSFEAWPTKHKPGLKGEDDVGWSLHEVLLGGWGCPIGELFDLEALSTECEKQERWTFFLTSEVGNVPGGVASPPNALAIF